MVIRSKFMLASDLESLSSFVSKRILGIIEFNHGNRMLKNYMPSVIPYLSVDLKPFETESLLEVWVSDQDVNYGTTDSFNFAYDGEFLFAAGLTGKKFYDEAFSVMKDFGYSNPLRMWNFIPYINHDHNYKSFCMGRIDAFRSNNLNQYPAATCVGSHSGNTGIYFISSKTKSCIHLENPVQIPAYKYFFGSDFKAPAFSRATIHNGIIFVSGTASIIGYESVHLGNVEKQCITTINNINALISGENLLNYCIDECYSLKNLDNVKVYLKNNNHYSLIKDICKNYFSPNASVEYFNADICRPELLIEIEGQVKNKDQL